ncbi:MAG: hypothetical protein ABI693_35480 [Bryobacteraceae bacterium]
MKRTAQLTQASFAAITLVFTLAMPVSAQALREAAVGTMRVGVVWHDPGQANSLDLINGAGGKKYRPGATFRFVKEDMKGTSPKFEVEDEHGVVWKVKLGEETKAETAATRLVWAAGYFVDEDYYVPEVRVANLPTLHRGRQFVSDNGVVHGARLERKIKGEKKGGTWSWSKNPLVGTKEMNGLRVLMALTNNWDLKQVNNDIYEGKDGERRYVVSDLGATFGKTGSPFTRSKSNLRDYSRTKFVQHVKPETVDFYLSSRPPLIAVFNLPNYIARTRMQAVAKNIPRSHAKWVGQLLGRLSAEQIRDCFRAGGYSPEEAEGFAKAVEGRIAELNQL